ncbi:hypothetical protein BaRGS_00037151, partial [Batillaria attramentaria]
MGADGESRKLKVTDLPKSAGLTDLIEAVVEEIAWEKNKDYLKKTKNPNTLSHCFDPQRWPFHLNLPMF